MVQVTREVRPRWPFRLPGGAPDGVLRRRRGGGIERLLHVEGAPAVVRVAQPARDRVVFVAGADSPGVAAEALARMRFALGIDDDLREFYDRFRDDPVIGRSVRARPGLRVVRRPDPFEALAWAICEQLVEFERAAAIQRRIVRRLGRRCDPAGLRDLPAPETLAAATPGLLESFDLSAGRALALRRAAREVAAGRADLSGPDQEGGWRRLRAIPGIGAWTVEMLALYGQGRYDQIPAGDLGYLRVIGRMTTGNPRALATEEEVRAFFARYDGWAGLAGAHLLGKGVW